MPKSHNLKDRTMSALKKILKDTPVVVKLIRALRGIRSLIQLTVGLIGYAWTGKTSNTSHQAMISVFCITKGRSNDFLSWIFGLFRRPYAFDKNSSGLAGKIGSDTIKQAVSALEEQGYYILQNKLPDAICDRLLAYATTHPCKLRPMDGNTAGSEMMGVYHRDAPQAVRYEFLQQDLLDNPDVQGLLADMSLAELAQAYLGARPVIDIVALWWHTAFSDRPDGEAAEYFHFDMDRPKWLKFFIYLNDVGPDNGPHSFVAGSHRTGAIPSELLEKGYARLTDEEVGQHFDKKDFIEFSAPRGTILAEDTRGLHKGKHVGHGDRLVMQIEFSNCLFGAYYPQPKMSADIAPELKEKIQQYPDLYSFLAGR